MKNNAENPLIVFTFYVFYCIFSFACLFAVVYNSLAQSERVGKEAQKPGTNKDKRLCFNVNATFKFLVLACVLFYVVV